MSADAGKIVFDITGDDSNLRKVLGGAKGHAMAASRAVGAAMTAAGAAITGFAAVSIRDFAAAGDEVQKMADRTGFSTERLSELRHAAELSGAELGNIEKASKTLSKVITEAGNGTQSYVDALGTVGLTYADLQALSPEQQFDMVALALADVENKTTQVAVAQELWGARAGTQLLPMLANGSAGLAEMAAEAHRLGIVFDQEGANKAALFNDQMQRMGESFTSFKYDVAEALIPVLIDLMVWVREVMVGFKEWREANPGLFESLTKITVVVGGVMTVLGPLLILLPGLATAFSALSAVIPLMGAALVALTGPVGWVIGAIALIGAAAYAFVDDWGAVWESIKAITAAAVDGVVQFFLPLFQAIGWALDGIDRLRGVGGSFQNPREGHEDYDGRSNQRGAGGGGGNQRGAGASGASAGVGDITINVNGATDPNAVSMLVASALRRELAARGI